MLTHFSSNEIPLPRDWTANVRTAVLHVISLARLAIACTRSFAANSLNARIRLASELERAKEEISRLEEELRIKERVPSYTSSDTLSRLVSISSKTLLELTDFLLRDESADAPTDSRSAGVKRAFVEPVVHLRGRNTQMA